MTAKKSGRAQSNNNCNYVTCTVKDLVLVWATEVKDDHAQRSNRGHCATWFVKDSGPYLQEGLVVNRMEKEQVGGPDSCCYAKESVEEQTCAVTGDPVQPNMNDNHVTWTVADLGSDVAKELEVKAGQENPDSDHQKVNTNGVTCSVNDSDP